DCRQARRSGRITLPPPGRSPPGPPTPADPPAPRRQDPPMTRARLACPPLALFCLACVARADPPIDYTREVKPILSRHCYSCHGEKAKKGGLRLDSAAALLKGGSSGPG